MHEDFMATVVLVALLILGGILLINYLVAKKFEEVAIQKGHEKSTSTSVFVMCLFLGITGMLYAIALPDKSVKAKTTDTKQQSEPIPDRKEFVCPKCRSKVYEGDSTCAVCGQGFNWKKN